MLNRKTWLVWFSNNQLLVNIWALLLYILLKQNDAVFNKSSSEYNLELLQVSEFCEIRILQII